MNNRKGIKDERVVSKCAICSGTFNYWICVFVKGADAFVEGVAVSQDGIMFRH